VQSHWLFHEASVGVGGQEMSLRSGAIGADMKILEKNELTWFKADPGQPRKEFGLAELEPLEASLFVRQDIPLIARPDGTIIDGERRWRAAQLKGRIKSLDVIITDEPMTPTELRVFQITSSVHRASLSAYEMWQACVELITLNPSLKLQDLATNLQLEPSSITRYLSPSKCIAAWQTALKSGQVGVSDCYEASKLPEGDQPELLALKLSGASRNAIAAVARKNRNGNRQTVKMARIKAPLSSGVEMVISGKELGLDEVIESLSELLKEAKKANDSGLDVKTWSAVLKDKAKAGA
jgi:ParB family transcriptional regulator, chromosome partitioning protein